MPLTETNRVPAYHVHTRDNVRQKPNNIVPAKFHLGNLVKLHGRRPMAKRLLGLAPSKGQVMLVLLELRRHELSPQNDRFLDNALDGVGPATKTNGNA